MPGLTVKARKTSQDPVQEALRKHKDNWNHEASLLIAQLIAFKKGLNGRGDSGVGLPPGSIKDPVPNEVGSYLNQLADRYNKLISDAHSIIDEQDRYSENRKKSVKAEFYDSEIIKIASWWGSRALTYLNNNDINNWRWFSTDEAVTTRMNLLKTSVALEKQLKLIDSYVVSKDINAIFNAVYEFDKFVSFFIEYMIANIKKLIILESDKKKLEDEREKFKFNQEKSVEPPNEVKISPEKVEDKPFKADLSKEPEYKLELSGKKVDEVGVKQILSDVIFSGKLVEFMILLNGQSKDISLFADEIKKIRKSLDELVISGKGSLEDINESYSFLKELSSKILKIKNDTFSNQLSEAEKLVSKKAKNVSVEFEKLANKWLEDRIRIEADKKISNLLVLIDTFQNFLEAKEPNVNVIKDAFKAIGAEIGELSNDLFYLAKTNNDEFDQDKLTGKPENSLIKQIKVNGLQKLKDVMNNLLSQIP